MALETDHLYNLTTLREELNKLEKEYLLIPDDDDAGHEFARFLFIGMHNGREMIFDTALYTLRLHHESELFEIAEHKAAQHFPEYKKIMYEEDENGNLRSLDDVEEEIGLFMAEVIMELEEEGSVKVKEHIDVDLGVESEVGLDVGLHIETVTEQVIEKFIVDYKSGNLRLDPTLYSFQSQAHEEG